MRVSRWFASSVLMAAACSSGAGGTVPGPVVAAVATVVVTPATATLNPAQTSQLTAIEKDSTGTTLSGRTVTWSSAVPAVAAVSATGLVSAVSLGSTSVSATSEGRSASATITVVAAPAPVAGVTVTPATATLVATQTTQLSAVAVDAGGTVLTGRSVNWLSATPAVATVSAGGVVTAVATGSALVTATSEGKTATATITVVDGTLVGPAGGTVIAAGGSVTISIPAGALSQPTGITVAPIALAPDNALVPGTSYAFGPDGTQFAQPVTVKIKYDAANIAAGFPQQSLAMFTGSTDTSVMIVGGTVDSIAHTVQATTTHFSVLRINQRNPLLVNQDGAVLTASYVSPVTICVGGYTEVVFDAWGSSLTGGTVTSGSPGTAVIGSSNLNLVDHTVHVVIGAVAPGASQVAVRMTGAAPIRSVTFFLTVIVSNQNPPCTPVAIAAARSTPSGDDIVSYLNGIVSQLTTGGFSTNPTLGAGAPVAGSWSTTENDFYRAYLIWDNSGGHLRQTAANLASTSATITTLPNLVQGTTYLDANTLLYGMHLQTGVDAGKSELWRVTQASNTPAPMTSLRGHIANPAAAANGVVYFDWYGVPQTGPTHIWSLVAPTGANPVPTSTAAAVTSGSAFGETAPAISQNNNLLVFAQIPLDFSGSRIQLKDLTDPGGPLVPVSPATGYAFSPSWCGNDFVYYVWAPGTNGPYLVYRWNRVTGTVNQLTAFSGASFPSISVARTNGDGGMHICPN